jgi:hypothetical protein
MMLFLLYDIEKSYLNARMPERRRKVSPASTFFPVVSCLSPASALRLQGSVGYSWSWSSWISTALPSYVVPITYGRIFAYPDTSYRYVQLDICLPGHQLDTYSWTFVFRDTSYTVQLDICLPGHQLDTVQLDICLPGHQLYSRTAGYFPSRTPVR